MTKYNCHFCGLNAKIETWETRIGIRWLCHWCGAGGRLTEFDAPTIIKDELMSRHEVTPELQAIFDERPVVAARARDASARLATAHLELRDAYNAFWFIERELDTLDAKRRELQAQPAIISAAG